VALAVKNKASLSLVQVTMTAWGHRKLFMTSAVMSCDLKIKRTDI